VPRRRLGAVLLLTGRAAAEVDGLRRACGDRALGRVPSHLTLVPPVNVREDDLPAALTRLRAAAAAVRGPVDVTLGPPATFLPDNPVLYLDVGGPGLPAVHRLRETVFAYPLERSLTWPFVPHVTLADNAEPDRIEAALIALADYSAEVTFDRLHLLEEGAERTWLPLADCPLGPADLVGRGGFEVELTTSDLLDPEAGAFLADHGAEPGPPPYVVARHRWEVVGVSDADATVVAPDHEPHGVAELLHRRQEAAATPD
jgi:2'-5' RNA ligase